MWSWWSTDESNIIVYCGNRGRDRMVAGFITTYAISAYHHWCCEFESRSGRGVQHYLIKFVSDLGKVGGFLRFPPLIELTATIKLKYCGIKHHNPPSMPFTFYYASVCWFPIPVDVYFHVKSSNVIEILLYFLFLCKWIKIPSKFEWCVSQVDM